MNINHLKLDCPVFRCATTTTFSSVYSFKRSCFDKVSYERFCSVFLKCIRYVSLPPALQRLSIHILYNRCSTHSCTVLGYWVPHTLQTVWPLALRIVWASLLDSCCCFFFNVFPKSELRGFLLLKSNWNECFICGLKQRSHKCGLFSSPHRRPVSREVQKWLHFPRDGYVVATISRSQHREGFAMWRILSMAMNILSVAKKYIQKDIYSFAMVQYSHTTTV